MTKLPLSVISSGKSNCRCDNYYTSIVSFLRKVKRENYLLVFIEKPSSKATTQFLNSSIVDTSYLVS